MYSMVCVDQSKGDIWINDTQTYLKKHYVYIYTSIYIYIYTLSDISMQIDVYIYIYIYTVNTYVKIFL